MENFVEKTIKFLILLRVTKCYNVQVSKNNSIVKTKKGFLNSKIGYIITKDKIKILF